MPKATRKAPTPVVKAPTLRLARGVAIPKVPKTIEAAAILSAAPIIITELPMFFDNLSDAQLKTGWRAVLCTTLVEELDCRGLLHKTEARGLIANFLRSMTVVHDRLVGPTQAEVGRMTYHSRK